MRKLLAIILAILFVISGSVVFAEVIDLSTMTDEELRGLRDTIDAELATRQAAAVLDGGVIAEGDVGEFHVAILSVARGTDYAGEPAIVVTYLFTNNGTQNETFMMAISDMVFQNGVQIETGVGVNGADFDTVMAAIKPGASIEVTQGYVLRDTTSPIEIEVSKLLDFSSNPQKVVAMVALP